MFKLFCVCSVASAVPGVSFFPARGLSALLAPWAGAPPSARRLWSGGDVATSIPLTPAHALWIFGDTLIGHWALNDTQRVNDVGKRMPHSSVAVFDTAAATLTYAWGAGDTSFFKAPWESAAAAFWTSVLFPPRGDAVCALGMKVQYLAPSGPFSFLVNGTVLACAAGAITNPAAPGGWAQSWAYVPGTGNTSAAADDLEFNNGVMYTGEGAGDFVHLVGYHRSRDQVTRQVLCRLTWAAFDAGDWASREYLNEGGLWGQWAGAGALATLWAPFIPELTVQYSPLRGQFFVVYTSFLEGPVVRIMFSPRLEGPWTAPAPIYDIPAPFNNSVLFFCYAAKAHGELAPLLAGGDACAAGEEAYVLTYACNAWDVETLFEPGYAAVYAPIYNTLCLSA